MKQIILLCFVLLQAGLCATHKSKCIQALIVADTDAANIGCSYDVDGMKKNLEIIASSIKFRLDCTVVMGDKFTDKSLVRWCKHLQKNSESIFLFYYSGHGYNNQKSSWPVMCLDGKEISGHTIVRYFQRIPKRLGIVLFDCCNSYSSCQHIMNHDINHLRFEGLDTRSQESLRGLRSLFLNSHGLIIAAASMPGETARSWKPLPGGVFSVGFFNALQNNCDNVQVSWEKIFSDAGQWVTGNTEGEQHSFYKLK